jgi:hypothetical protein
VLFRHRKHAKPLSSSWRRSATRAPISPLVARYTAPHGGYPIAPAERSRAIVLPL